MDKDSIASFIFLNKTFGRGILNVGGYNACSQIK